MRDLDHFKESYGQDMKYIIDIRKQEWMRILTKCHPQEPQGVYVIDAHTTTWEKLTPWELFKLDNNPVWELQSADSSPYPLWIASNGYTQDALRCVD